MDHINGGGEGGKRGREEERERGEEKGGGGGFREEDLFDDPKYASSMWIEQTMLKVQVSLVSAHFQDRAFPHRIL